LSALRYVVTGPIEVKMNTHDVAMTGAAATLDFGRSPLATPALLAAALTVAHPMAYMVGGGPAILALAFVDPLLILVLLRALFRGAGVLSLRRNRLRHYRGAGFIGDTFFMGSRGNFFAASTSKRKLFADNVIHDFDDVDEIIWREQGGGVLEVTFTRGATPLVRLVMSNATEAATAAQRLRNLVEER
jgi:hypothetical protein